MVMPEAKSELHPAIVMNLPQKQPEIASRDLFCYYAPDHKLVVSLWQKNSTGPLARIGQRYRPTA
jgi:hypothetical protein